MNTVDFDIAISDVQTACSNKKETDAMVSFLNHFPDEADPDYIRLYVSVDFLYDDDTQVPYGDTYTTLPPSWEIDKVTILDAYMEDHDVATDVPNAPFISIKGVTLDLKELDMLPVLSKLVISYLNKNSKEFSKWINDAIDSADYYDEAD